MHTALKKVRFWLSCGQNITVPVLHRYAFHHPHGPRFAPLSTKIGRQLAGLVDGACAYLNSTLISYTALEISARRPTLYLNFSQTMYITHPWKKSFAYYRWNITIPPTVVPALSSHLRQIKACQLTSLTPWTRQVLPPIGVKFIAAQAAFDFCQTAARQLGLAGTKFEMNEKTFNTPRTNKRGTSKFVPASFRQQTLTWAHHPPLSGPSGQRRTY